MGNWVKKTLQDICERITDGTHQTPTYYDEGYVFLSSKNVTSQKIDWEDVRYVDEKQYLEFQKRISPKKGDILLAKNGTTGVAAMVDRDIPFNIYVSLAWLRSKGEVIPEYLLYFINSPIAKQQFNSRLKGVGVPNLHLKEIREVKISFPTDKNEQRRVVSKLDSLFSEIDSSLALIDQNIEKAEALKLSVLDEELSDNDGWKEVNLGQCFRLKSGENLTKKNMIMDGEYLVYGGNGVAGNHNEYNLEGENIIIGRVGALCGNVHLVKEKIWLTDNAFKVDDLKFKFDYKFLTHLLNYKNLRSYANESAQPVISNTTLKNVQLSFPSNVNEQNRIAEKIKGIFIEIDKLIEEYNSKRFHLEALKNSLLDSAFKGEL